MRENTLRLYFKFTQKQIIQRIRTEKIPENLNWNKLQEQWKNATLQFVKDFPQLAKIVIAFPKKLKSIINIYSGHESFFTIG